MNKNRYGLCLKSLTWMAGGTFCLVSLLGATFIGIHPSPSAFHWKLDHQATDTLRELRRLSLLDTLAPDTIEALVAHQRTTGRSLAQILRDPEWLNRLGLASRSFKATWYMANPYELLPPALQDAIRRQPVPFSSSAHVWQWCRANGAPQEWFQALSAALIETTATNLWRASRGWRPYVKNGEFLEPIVIDHGLGNLEIRDGHIATDPRIIPTNTDVLLLVKIKGRERVLRVKAADVGSAIKGYHVDLPIHVGPIARPMPFTLLPKDELRNPTVEILLPIPQGRHAKVNRGQRA